MSLHFLSNIPWMYHHGWWQGCIMILLTGKTSVSVGYMRVLPRMFEQKRSTKALSSGNNRCLVGLLWRLIPKVERAADTQFLPISDCAMAGCMGIWVLDERARWNMLFTTDSAEVTWCLKWLAEPLVLVVSQFCRWFWLAQSDGLMIYTVWQTVIRVQQFVLHDFKTESPYKSCKQTICTVILLHA